MASKLVQNSAKLLFANVFAQAIGLAVYPILTRLYAPEDFGALNVFLSMAGIVTLVSTAEFQYAIVLPKDDKKAWNVLQCGLIVLVTVSLCCIWKPLLALYVLVMGLWTLMNYWYTRQQQFINISRYQMGQSIGSAAIKTGLAYTPVNGGLIWGSVLAPLISLLTNWFYAGRKSVGERWKTPFRKEELRYTILEYRNFPCYNLPRSLVNNLGCNLPSLLLAPVFGLTELGFFSMALTLAFRPVNMISSSIYQVLYQQFSEQVNKKESIRPLFSIYLKGATIASIILITLLWSILPQLCQWLLGSQWAICGEYIRWMLPWIAITILVGPICSLCDVFSEQKKGLWFELLLAIVSLIGLGIGIYTNSILHAIIGYCMGSFIVIFLQLMWYISLVTKYEHGLIEENLKH